jgi:hypothetical protein
MLGIFNRRGIFNKWERFVEGCPRKSLKVRQGEKSLFKNLIESPNLIKTLIPSRSLYYIKSLLSHCREMWVCRSNSPPP